MKKISTKIVIVMLSCCITMTILVEKTLDLDRMKDQNYIREFKDSLSPVFKDIIQKVDDCTGTYLIIDPKINGNLEYISYIDKSGELNLLINKFKL